MKSRLPIIVKFQFDSKEVEYLRSELLKILEPTRKEKGCILYELHRDINDPNIFMFYEIWESRDAWMKHDKMPYIVHFKNVLDNSNTKVTFNLLETL